MVPFKEVGYRELITSPAKYSKFPSKKYANNRNKNNQKPYMINENQECKMDYFAKIIEKILFTNILDVQNFSSEVINIFTKLDIKS